MTISYLRYDLSDGYVHNWLVAGPQPIPVSELGEGSEQDVRRRVAHDTYEEALGITGQPVERGPLSEGTFTVGDYEGAWSYTRSLEDHFVDLSDHYPMCRYLRAWAYAEVEVADAQDVSFVLTVDGGADVWLNGAPIHRMPYDGDQLRTVTFDTSLQAGRNTILVRFDQVGLRATAHRLALRLVGLSAKALAGASIVLPTTVEPVERRRKFERVLEAAYLDQAVYESHDEITVHWDDSAGDWEMFVGISLRTAGHIHAHAEIPQKPVGGKVMGHPFQFPEGRYDVVLMPPTEEYAIDNMRIRRALPFWALGNNDYSDVKYGDLPSRRAEALRHAARYSDDLFAEIAKMAIQWWSRVEMPVIRRAIERVNTRQAGSVVDLLGLLGMLTRFGEQAQFPEELRGPLESAILNYRYWCDEPGDDVMQCAAASRGLLFHTCEILAGQLYPEQEFSNVGKSGAWHLEKGQRLAIAWMQAQGIGGFSAWDSDVAYDEMLAALVHLEEFAEADDVWEPATILMDKILFEIAVNSYKGVFGSAHGITETPQTLNGMLSATSGISRLMWGMGAFNHHTIGAVSLACAENYGFPRLIQEIATDHAVELWSREQHAAESAERPVNKVTYRTADYMLSSAQDFYPGEAGDREHIWQATMSPAAQVFVNHPANASQQDVLSPNFWRGNGILPRVAQWKDVLVAVHKLPDADWMGFTHAYFPVHAFYAYELRDGWAFAQFGNAYLALTASQGMQLTEAGLHARHELRSYGTQNVWLCHMGRAAADGTFAQFQDAILALDVAFEELAVRLTSLRGETISFGWQGPLEINGEPQAIAGFRHHESRYGVADLPAEELVVVFGEQALRLSLA